MADVKGAPSANGPKVNPTISGAIAKGGQTIPAQAPAAPAAPAAKAAKASKKPDLSKLSAEDRAKFEKAMDDAAELRKKAAEVKAYQNSILGISKPARASTAGGGLLGLNPNLRVTAVTDATTGFKGDANKSVAQKLTGDGMPLSELVKLDGVDASWVRYRFVRGSLRINGKTFAEVLNGLAAQPAAQAA